MLQVTAGRLLPPHGPGIQVQLPLHATPRPAAEAGLSSDPHVAESPQDEVGGSQHSKGTASAASQEFPSSSPAFGRHAHQDSTASCPDAGPHCTAECNSCDQSSDSPQGLYPPGVQAKPADNLVAAHPAASSVPEPQSACPSASHAALSTASQDNHGASRLVPAPEMPMRSTSNPHGHVVDRDKESEQNASAANKYQQEILPRPSLQSQHEVRARIRQPVQPFQAVLPDIHLAVLSGLLGHLPKLLSVITVLLRLWLEWLLYML